MEINNKYQYQVSRGNELKFGYSGKVFNRRETGDDQFWITYPRCSRPTHDWRTECVIAAQEIGRVYQGRELFLCLSGGIDSEVMARAFVAGGIPFRTIITRYSNDINIHDISWAVIFCEGNAIPYEIYDLDVVSFWESGEMYVYAEVGQCISPQMANLLKIMDHIHGRGGVPVLGCGEIMIAYESSAWFVHGSERYFSLYHYLMRRGKPGAPRFFQWNPEIMYSYLTAPVLKRHLMRPGNETSNSLAFKPDIYGTYWPLQPRPKYTGYEKIWKLDQKHRAELMKRHPFSGAVVKTELGQLIDQMRPG